MALDETKLAPVVVFAYNRADLLKNTLCSLKNAVLSEKSDIYIYIDCPSNLAGDKEKVESVRKIAENFEIGRSKTIRVSSVHLGLAKSVIGGTTEIINRYGSVIVVEDDLHLSPSFLIYMNTMLQAYESDNRIMQISGFGVKISSSTKDYSEIYLNKRAQSWGWATWKNRWDTMDWEISDYELFMKNKIQKRNFKRLGSDLLQTLHSYKKENKDIWLIAYIYNMYSKNMFSVCPFRSLVRNDGFGVDASNCKNYNRYRIDFNKEILKSDAPQSIVYDENHGKEAVKYWNYWWRAYGFFMTKLNHFFRVYKIFSRKNFINNL